MVYFSQSRYAIHLLEHAFMKNCKPISTPLFTCHNLSKSVNSLSPSFVSSYKSNVGALQYLTTTKPVLTFAANVMSQFKHCPNLNDEQSVKRILCYIKGTINFDNGILS